ncbi:MAG TPA: dihydrolipoamide acetyltransferase family protein [Candidatus Elarobacter sp.]|nr:dihydrolipoamide acetyltransferase family protein [Candidatus Elarobacter sp.]
MTVPALVELRLADVGEGLAEAEIVEWLVRPGDVVAADQPIVIVMTDKASVELPAPVAGTVRECAGEPGTIVPTGTVLARIESSAPRAAPSSAVQAAPSSAVQAAPSTRRRAAELGVDLRAVAGSGPGGRVLAEDVERHAAAHGSPPANAGMAQSSDGIGAGEVVPLRGLRRQTAHAVAQSWRTVPQIAEFRDVDATALVRARGDALARRADGDQPFTYLPFFVRATAEALRAHPSFNASIDLEHDTITRRRAYNIGIAVAVGDALIVPVLRDAASLDLDALAAALDGLIARARDGKLRPDELSGASVTITNVGSYGTEFGVPIVRAGESAIVAFGRIRDAVVAVAGVPVVRAMLPLTVSADHRLNDGRALAAFAATIAGRCREPAPPHR